MDLSSRWALVQGLENLIMLGAEFCPLGLRKGQEIGAWK
jgi:hypothetical protein